jgi:hypothetical protein
MIIGGSGVYRGIGNPEQPNDKKKGPIDWPSS